MPTKKPNPKKPPAKSTKPKTIAAYIDRAPPDAQKNLRDLYAVLKKVAPKATEAIKWSNPVFEEGRILFAFAGHKNHTNFTPTPATIDAFRDELKGYAIGAMTVSLPHDKPIPKGLIRKMAAWRLRDLRENDARWM
jgi:uncharacterized protein YdhG (YjbR/CyaY superfamily)